MADKQPVCQLPVELIEIILDHLGTDLGNTSRLADLSKCALASRSFRPRAQSYLFASIVIHGEKRKRDKRIRELVQILKKSPVLAQHITELTLEFTDHQYVWISQDRRLLDIMAKISTPPKPLRKFILTAARGPQYVHRSVLIETIGVLERIVQPFVAPFITSLTLQELFKVPIEVIASCSNLVALELLSVTLENTNPFGRFQEQILRLQHLAQWESQYTLSDLVNAPNDVNFTLDLSLLKTYTTYTDGVFTMEVDQNIIDRACDSLKELHVLTFRPAYNRLWFYGQTLNLSNLTSLQLLHMHTLFPDDNLLSVSRTLASIKDDSLPTLHVEAKVGFIRPAEPEDVLAEDVDWATFCSQVARVMTSSQSESKASLEFSISYRYDALSNDTGMDWESYEGSLATRCRAVVGTIERENFRRLKDTCPHLTIISLYRLEYADVFAETW